MQFYMVQNNDSFLSQILAFIDSYESFLIYAQTSTESNITNSRVPTTKFMR